MRSLWEGTFIEDTLIDVGLVQPTPKQRFLRFFRNNSFWEDDDDNFWDYAADELLRAAANALGGDLDRFDVWDVVSDEFLYNIDSSIDELKDKKRVTKLVEMRDRLAAMRASQGEIRDDEAEADSEARDNASNGSFCQGNQNTETLEPQALLEELQSLVDEMKKLKKMPSHRHSTGRHHSAYDKTYVTSNSLSHHATTSPAARSEASWRNKTITKSAYVTPQEYHNNVLRRRKPTQEDFISELKNSVTRRSGSKCPNEDARPLVDQPVKSILKKVTYSEPHSDTKRQDEDKDLDESDKLSKYQLLKVTEDVIEAGKIVDNDESASVVGEIPVAKQQKRGFFTSRRMKQSQKEKGRGN
jgi:hypothetical protein